LILAALAIATAGVVAQGKSEAAKDKDTHGTSVSDAAKKTGTATKEAAKATGKGTAAGARRSLVSESRML